MVRILEVLGHQGCAFKDDTGFWPLPVTLFDIWIP